MERAIFQNKISDSINMRSGLYMFAMNCAIVYR